MGCQTQQGWNSNYCGFDYGTSNCALGVYRKTGQQKPQTELLNLEGRKTFIPSTLYALSRELICEFVASHMTTGQDAFINRRSSALAQARWVRKEKGFEPNEQALFFGREAFEQYFDFPEEGHFVKSPKSFLGASGLRVEQVAFFEDIVTAMMQNIKQKAEAQLHQTLAHTVIGRPVNFQGLNAEKSNQQAIDILTTAAHRAGFQSVEFLYEPIAAGLHFENQLTRNQTVLVVDVGGGTTDCAVVRMGPDYCHKDDRRPDFLGHAGERVGGNDLDIQLAAHCLLPLFGSRSSQKSGKPVPKLPFINAITTNDVGALADFNSLETGLLLKQLLRDSAEPELIQRFINLRKDRQNHQLVRTAEQSKIALSSSKADKADLSFIETGLTHTVSYEHMEMAVTRPVNKMMALIDEVLVQAGCKPDLIYITGGSAQSPVIRQAITQKLPGIDIVDGDHFGSVAAGLTVWSQKIFS